MARDRILLVSLLIIVISGVPIVRANESLEWRIMINIPEYRLYLYHDEEMYETFPVAVGKPGSPSPIGDFWITCKVVNPIWCPIGKKPVPPGPKNPLGKYWLGLNKRGYGIHGNNSAGSIGHSVSNGCFRMSNNDIEKLFNLIPKNTPVHISYQTVLGKVDIEQRAWLEVFPDIYHLVDLEQTVGDVLMELGWIYQPHFKAMKELLQDQKLKTIEVPRVIKVTGELANQDAFFWNNDVYFEKLNFNLDEVVTQTLNEQVSYKEYIGTKTLDAVLLGKYKYELNKDLGLVNVHRFKVLYNNFEIEDLGRCIQGTPCLNLEKMAQVMDMEFVWNRESPEVQIGGKQLTGLYLGGVFWVPVADFIELWPSANFNWDEQNWMLKLTIKSKYSTSSFGDSKYHYSRSW